MCVGVLLWVCAGKSALHLAGMYGNAAVAEMLLAKGADVNLQDNDGTRCTEGPAWGWGSMGVVSLGYERCWCMRRAHGGMWCMRMRQWGCQCRQRAGPATCVVCLSSIWACGAVYACGASSRAACAGEWQPAAHSCVGCKGLQGLGGASRVSHRHPSKHCWRGSMGCVGPLRLVLHSTRH